MDNGLRIGLIGAGRIAELGHLPGYRRAGAKVVALCSLGDALDRLADQYQVERRYTDWNDMIADGGFDAVSICTPPALHSEMTVAAAQHGYHVLVEKPMALSLPECDQMIAAARDANVILMVAHNQRFSARHQIAKQILDSGRLGKPYAAHGAFAHGGPENWSPTQKWYFEARLTRMGVIADLGSHKIDLLRWLLGQEVVEISTLESTFEKPTTAEDTAVLNLRFTGGTLATLYVGWTHRPAYVDSLSIQCERGAITIPTDASQPVRVLEQDRDWAGVESLYPFEADDVPGWAGAVAAFVDAIANGKSSPVSGEEGRATMAAVLSAYESAANKTIVLLNPSSPSGGT